ncbi:single-stranded DNA-binding protein [Legionella erythra]|uniref:Single-stranded DNA-binding protein n=1 Tax=Legionella erythra TaxID=448 RepID=A0A0W0TGH0_LEGER|nr:single-stranded DNA-binding protein [Legionella erythra]KTC94705.1 single strand DNA binding protein [Legionella erythra]
MTTSLNRVQLIGNLGSEPKTITNKDGFSFVTATLATNESFKQNDQWKTHVEWHNLVIFGDQSRIINSLHKGSLIFIEGKLRSNLWTDKEGKGRQSLSIVVSNIHLLDKTNDCKSTTSSTAESHMAQMRGMLLDDSTDEKL